MRINIGKSLLTQIMMISLSLTATPLVYGQSRSTACADLTKLQMPGTSIQITKAEQIPAAAPGTTRISPNLPGTLTVGLPSFCRVDGVIDRRTGVAGKSYGIGFALALPDNWNARFLFQGGGGLNGNVATPLGAGAAGSTPALARGYAAVTSDTGHQGAVFDPAFSRTSRRVWISTTWRSAE